MEQLRICTWNLSECISSVWDFENGVTYKAGENVKKCAKLIIDTINCYNPDIICFQEFPVKSCEGFSLVEEIARNTDLKYYSYIDTCPSFLFEGGRIGIATFSRFNMVKNEIVYFNNPNLEMVSKSGAVYKSFDKAFIVSAISDEFLLYNCHGISFAPFGKKPIDYPESYFPLYKSIIEKNCCQQIIAGDLNTSDFSAIFPDLKSMISDKLVGATTPPGWREGKYYPKGKKLDSFYVTSKINVTNVEKVHNFSDHFLCVITCEIDS